MTENISFDYWAVLDFWRRRWYLLAIATVAAAFAGAYAARVFWGKSFTAEAQLMRYQPSSVDDAFRPRDISTPSLVLMLQSPDLLEKVGAQSQPRLSAEQLAKRLQITVDRNNDIVTVTADGPGRDDTVGLVNRFCAAAIGTTRDMQRREATEAQDYISKQLAGVEGALAAARTAPDAATAEAAALPALSDETPADTAELSLRIHEAEDRLVDLSARYTDAHPLVVEQRARLAALEDLRRQAEASRAAARRTASSAVPAAAFGRLTPQEVALGERLRSLETDRALLKGRERAIEPFAKDPPGYFRVLVPATDDRTYQHNHRMEIVVCACLGAFLGLFGSALQILLGEFFDNRIKTRGDIRRVTALPLLATLGNLARLGPAERNQWAFRTWTALQNRLSLSPNHGMVCGVTSARQGEGKSTWIELIAGAASDCGFRVLTITAKRNDDPKRAEESARSKPPFPRQGRRDPAAPSSPPESGRNGELVALSSNVLASPGEITAKLAAPDGPPRVNIPLPGWVWNLERRKQWGLALEAWRAVEHVVIFVELPPVSEPETVLLAENIPNLLWLVERGKSDAAETHAGLETLRDARCNLVGAVLNREEAPVRGRFNRWIGRSAFLLAACLCLSSARGLAQSAPASASTPAPSDELSTPPAAESTAPAAEPPAPDQQEAFAVVAPSQRAAWQEHLTLGPGDVLNFHLFGSPELTRENVPVGPDGRVSYLEAEGIQASGLTIDELRGRLERELGNFRRSPQVFITPVAFRSKKYFVLGSVAQKGAFALDRPITIIEAVARARGFESRVSGGVLTESVDFSRAFLSRGGRHMPVDFERLFLHGDLSQNVALEPSDYLYFPTAGSTLVYVLGEVRSPGPAPLEADASVLSAVAERGGFTERAWTDRVLVVRGSLEHPQAFRVNPAAVLKGEGANFALRPGDLVYVSSRPWIRVEELLDHAASAFVESATVTWTSIHVGPGFTPSVPISP